MDAVHCGCRASAETPAKVGVAASVHRTQTNCRSPVLDLRSVLATNNWQTNRVLAFSAYICSALK